MRVALILGAGWSAAAGYPLAQDLLRGTVHVGSEESRRRVQAVLDAYDQRDPEAFLATVRRGEILVPPNPGEPSLFDEPLPWRWAVEAVMLRLTWPEPASAKARARLLPARTDFRKRRGGHLEERAAEHEAFVSAILAEHEVVGVVTTNYDTLAEGVLRDGFHYGGLGPDQRARGASAWEYYNEPNPDQNAIALTGAIPLCKLQGSLNWERAGVIWRDMRVPHRDPGAAEIAVQIPAVWEAAHEVLANAERWIVVGYSAQDAAVRELLIASRGMLVDVEVHDPAPDLPLWQELTGVPVSSHPGIAAAAARTVNRLAFFYGIDIYMPWPPAAGEAPHFRAKYGSNRASIGLDGLALIDGTLPDRALGLVREWASVHADELERNWTRALVNQSPASIAPLE